MAETAHFRKNPFSPGTDLTIDTLISFTFFENVIINYYDKLFLN